MTAQLKRCSPAAAAASPPLGTNTPIVAVAGYAGLLPNTGAGSGRRSLLPMGDAACYSIGSTSSSGG
ncbi:hypothetical protein HK405_010458, partial [Cladochytrium tenue]